jgi:hypothetical protein
LKLSATPFCQGFPGSIKAVLIPCASIQDNSAFEIGLLSLRKKAGALRWLTSRANTSITLPRADPASNIDSQSLLGELVGDGEAFELSC